MKNEISSLQNSFGKNGKIVENKLKKLLSAHQRGWVFTPRHFLGIESRQAMNLAIFRLVRRGTIRRFARGSCDFPKIHPKQRILVPSIESVAVALRATNCIRVHPLISAHQCHQMSIEEI